MGTNIVGLWQQVVMLLRHATQDPTSCGDFDLTIGVTALLNRLESLPPTPVSTWEEMLQQQV